MTIFKGRSGLESSRAFDIAVARGPDRTCETCATMDAEERLIYGRCKSCRAPYVCHPECEHMWPYCERQLIAQSDAMQRAHEIEQDLEREHELSPYQRSELSPQVFDAGLDVRYTVEWYTK